VALATCWPTWKAQVEELTGQAGLQILRAILENEVTRRVGSPHRPNPTAGCVRWRKQPVMWFLVDRNFRWSNRWYERARAWKWNWRATVSCSKTESCNERCGNAWWLDCPHGVVLAETSGAGEAEEKSQLCDDYHRFENVARFGGLRRFAAVSSRWPIISELTGETEDD
jgi:hypothetical protein